MEKSGPTPVSNLYMPEFGGNLVFKDLDMKSKGRPKILSKFLEGHETAQIPIGGCFCAYRNKNYRDLLISVEFNVADKAEIVSKLAVANNRVTVKPLRTEEHVLEQTGKTSISSEVKSKVIVCLLCLKWKHESVKAKYGLSSAQVKSIFEEYTQKLSESCKVAKAKKRGDKKIFS